jgi:hypothetical protein
MTSPEVPRTIRGVVLSEDGRPATDVVVGLASGPVPLPDIAAVTGERGDFILTAPAVGQYVVTVSYPDGRQESRTLDVAEEDTEVALQVRPGGSGGS